MEEEQARREEEKRVQHKVVEMAKTEREWEDKKVFEKVWAEKRREQIVARGEERKREREEERQELERKKQTLEDEIEKEKKLQRVSVILAIPIVYMCHP